MSHGIAWSIHLVDDEQRARGAPSQGTRDRAVEIGGSRESVDHEDHHVRELDRQLRLTPHQGFAPRRGTRQESPRVDQHERPSPPLRGCGVAVAGDARAVVYDGTAGPENAVEERGLADVRASDDGDDGGGHGVACSFKGPGRIQPGSDSVRRRAGAGGLPPRRAVRATRDGAGNGVRTRDLKLGKLALYQLSYARPTR